MEQQMVEEFIREDLVQVNHTRGVLYFILVVLAHLYHI